MTLKIGTHHGPFHADDVLAAALIRHFLDKDAEVVRTRDKARLESLDIVYDVGGVFDEKTRRFDHHQREYEGHRSSAGMVLDYLEKEGHVSQAVAHRLREELVNYVDAVDTGARVPDDGVPCFSSLVGMLTESVNNENFDEAYEFAARFAQNIVMAIEAGYERAKADAEEVLLAMEVAQREKRKVVILESYKKWKPAYFENGGETHPTSFVMFPDKEGWRIVTIPCAIDTREDKEKLPASWSGLEGEALCEAIGLPGARFCHKNLFTAGFLSREGAEDALKKWSLWRS